GTSGRRGPRSTWPSVAAPRGERDELLGRVVDRVARDAPDRVAGLPPGLLLARVLLGEQVVLRPVDLDDQPIPDHVRLLAGNLDVDPRRRGADVVEHLEPKSLGVGTRAVVGDRRVAGGEVT